jgi:hypothetical protein
MGSFIRMLCCALVALLTVSVHAQTKSFGYGSSLYYWKWEESSGTVVRFEETRVTGCHKDGSLTLTRETFVKTYGGTYDMPVRTNMRVGVGDVFLLYDRNGATTSMILVRITGCTGEFRLADGALR